MLAFLIEDNARKKQNQCSEADVNATTLIGFILLNISPHATRVWKKKSSLSEDTCTINTPLLNMLLTINVHTWKYIHHHYHIFILME